MKLNFGVIEYVIVQFFHKTCKTYFIYFTKHSLTHSYFEISYKKYLLILSIFNFKKYFLQCICYIFNLKNVIRPLFFNNIKQ